MTKWRLFGSTVAILVMAVLLAVLATFLPDDPYQRFQQLDGTIYETARWAYERAHFDPRPLDVVIVGDSRTMLGLKSSAIEQQLAEAGKPATVANMSLVGDGRNSEWLLVEQTLQAKSPKVLVMTLTERPFPWGHDAFKYLAPAPEIWREASYGLHDARKNLTLLSFRQLKLFLASLFPNVIGLSRTFDPIAYAKTPTDFTVSHWTPDGRWLEMTKPVPRPVLIAQARAHSKNFERRSRLPATIRRFSDADERIYIDLIAKAAAKHGVKILFVFIPTFHGPTDIQHRAYYERLGAVLDNSDLTDRDELYQGWAHLNSAGAQIASARVAVALAGMLPPPSSPGAADARAAAVLPRPAR